MAQNLKTRLDGHFVACSALAAAAAVGGVAQTSEAAIVHSGPVNINIPTTLSGVYLNVVTGVNDPTASNVPGWDVNPWSSTALNMFAPSGGPAGSAGHMGNANTYFNLAPGTMIGPASTFSGTGVANLDPTSTLNFNSADNLVGFRFLNEATNETHYGWMRISLSSTATAQPRAIVEYAYEDQPGVGIGAGVVPAPGSLALLALGAAGLAGRRRK